MIPELIRTQACLPCRAARSVSELGEWSSFSFTHPLSTSLSLCLCLGNATYGSGAAHGLVVLCHCSHLHQMKGTIAKGCRFDLFLLNRSAGPNSWQPSQSQSCVMKGYIMAGSSVSFYLSFLVQHVPGGDWQVLVLNPALPLFPGDNSSILCSDPSSLWLPWKLLLPSQFFKTLQLSDPGMFFWEGRNSFANRCALAVLPVVFIRLNQVYILQLHFPLQKPDSVPSFLVLYIIIP